MINGIREGIYIFTAMQAVKQDQQQKIYFEIFRKIHRKYLW